MVASVARLIEALQPRALTWLSKAYLPGFGKCVYKACYEGLLVLGLGRAVPYQGRRPTKVVRRPTRGYPWFRR